MRNLISVVKFTVMDIIHQKSFFVMLAISIGFVMLLRGCYKGNYVVNGQTVNNLTVAWNASIAAFHVICVGALFIAAVLSMTLLRRDRKDGTAVYMLSKPIDRSVYVLGRSVGLWLVSSAFMFILHCAIFIITLLSAGGTMPGYLTASLVCSVNMFFMVLLICILSLYMSDFAAAFLGLGVVAISYISDGLFQLMQTKLVQAATGTTMPHDVSLWRLVWPKVSSLQYFAGSIIDNSTFVSIGGIHPLAVMTVYVAALAALLVFTFKKKEL